MEYNTNDQLRTYFIKQIQSISGQEISKVKEEIQRVTQKKMTEIKNTAKLNVDLMLEQEIKALNSEHSLNISKLSEQNNQKKTMMREQLIHELFDTIQAKLLAYSTTDEYIKRLVVKLGEAHKTYGYSGVVHTKAADQSAFEDAIKTHNLPYEVVVDETIEIGGFVLEFSDASILMDETLDTRLRDEMRAFYENPELILE